MHICVNLTGNGRLETTSIQTKATDPGFQTLNLTLVCGGGQCQYSREFYEPGLKLTPISNAAPLRGDTLTWRLGVW
ncbi:MAG: hypothetical protein V7K67_03990 [Nostoc sp.]